MCLQPSLPDSDRGRLSGGSQREGPGERDYECKYALPPQPWPSTLPLLQVWCDIPKVKRTRTAAEEEEELAGRDMSSLEVNYV